MIDITQPDMILMRDGVTVSRHRSPVEAMERAVRWWSRTLSRNQNQSQSQIQSLSQNPAGSRRA